MKHKEWRCHRVLRESLYANRQCGRQSREQLGT